MTLQDDYQTIRTNAAIGAISPRRQLAVAGKDRAGFLQGLLTNDISALAAGKGCYSAWLTPHGRMLTDMHVLASGSMILLDVPEQTAAATLARLDEFLFSEDVQLGSLAGTLTGVWVHGPEAGAILQRVVKTEHDLARWSDYSHGPAELDGRAVSVARIDQLAVPGYCVYLPPDMESSLVAALDAAGARTVARDALEAARIEAAYPLFGPDMTEDTIPLEAMIEDRAISLTKGCYVGQEVIVRVLHRGQGRVARKLVSLRVDGPVPARGAKVYAGDREVGAVTSAAAVPSLGTLALGYVRREFTPAGTALTVQSAAAPVSAVVMERRAATTA